MECGYYFESGNANDLAKMIEKVMSYYENNTIQEFVNKAYERVVEEFDVKRTGLNYIKSYCK